ncbi:hypothetical protein D3C81_2123740 [compost metagenome]
MHDINLKPKDPKGVIARGGALELSGTVKTYRYLDDTELEEQEKLAEAAKNAEKKGGK